MAVCDRVCVGPAVMLGRVARLRLQSFREQKHYRTIMALPLIFGSDILELAEFFDRCRVKRHAVTYESVTAISNAEADDLVKAVGELRETVEVWLQERHPDLVP